MSMFHLLKIRTSIDIFKNEKCKVTFGLVYTFQNVTRPSGDHHVQEDVDTVETVLPAM